MKKQVNKRQSKKRELYLGIIFLLFICISIGYALLTQTLAANGVLQIEKANWRIIFENPVVSPGSVTMELPELSEDSTVLTYKLGMVTPGSFYEFVVDVVNKGDIPAKLSDNPTITNIENYKFLEYTVTYEDGTPIKINDTLDVGEVKKLRLTIKYRKDIEDLPDSTVITLLFSMNYIQN